MSKPRIHSLTPTLLVLASLFCLLLAERVFAGSEGQRMTFAVLAVGLLAVAVGGRVLAAMNAAPEHKYQRRRLLLSTGLVAVGFVFYAMLALLFTEDSLYHQRWRGVLWALWPLCVVLGLIPLLALETAVMPVAHNSGYEFDRTRQAYERGLALALFLGLLFVGNYIVNRHDTKWNLSAGHQAVAGPETQQAVREVTKDVEVVLFFPRSNEVADSVEQYFEPLLALNPKLSLRRSDFALASDAARKAKVTENGYIAVIRDKVAEKIRLGTKARSARSALRRLDKSFVKALLEVTTKERVAYFTSGHGERAVDRADKDDKRPTLRSLKKLLENWQFKVDYLSLSTGLSEKVPDDANVVFIMGPKQNFLPAEIETLLEATKRGVRLVVALDAEHADVDMSALLGPLGIKTELGTIANVGTSAPITRTKRDHHSVFVLKFSSHPSMTTNSRNPRKLAAVVDKALALAADNSGKAKDVKAEMVMHAPEDSFLDLNDDFEFNAETEAKKSYPVAAAITRTSTTGKKEDEARIWVIGDVDIFAETLVRGVEGNIFVFRDVVAWLQRDVNITPPTVSEDDVKIVHKKEDDALLFYGTTFGMPLLVLLGGWFVTRRRS